MIGLIAIVYIAVASACFASSIANAKGCDSSAWTLAGFLCGPLALLAIAGMPDRKTQRIIRLMADSQGVDLQSVADIQDLPAEETGFAASAKASPDQLWALAIESVGPEIARLVSREKSLLSPGLISLRSAGGNTLFIFKSTIYSQDKALWKGRSVT
jgi:hypothetical protein